MSAKKLTPPADAPKIPEGWVYKGVDWDSKVQVVYSCWSPDCDNHKWTMSKGARKTVPGFGVHYITPAPKRAKKKATTKAPANITAKRRLLGNNIPVFILPADADSYERMVEQVMDGIEASWLEQQPVVFAPQAMARAALAAIGIKGARK